MGLFEGKTGVVFGIANERSIAWAITQELAKEGAVMGFTHLPDKDPARPKNYNKVQRLVEPLGSKFCIPCDVTSDEDLDAAFKKTEETFGKIDFVVHSVAFAPPADLTGPVYKVSRTGFLQSMEISVYSLMAMAGRAQPILNTGGSLLTLSYLGGERVIPGYNLMGLCKAALENAVMYLANEMGQENAVRVNAISAGVVKTISASGVGDLKKMLELYERLTPLRRNVAEEQIGKAAAFLLSEAAAGVTGEILHVDSGYHIVGAPPVNFGDE